jgi:anti-sigma regulatory factor (Ser/Thr protein kinase)
MKKGFRRHISALEEIFADLDEFLSQKKLDDRITFVLKLVVEELFTNLIRHNVGGLDQVTLDISFESGKLKVVLEDFEVEPFDVASIQPADISSPLEARKVGGLGIHIVRSYVDDLVYEYLDGTLRITAVMDLEEYDVRH